MRNEGVGRVAYAVLSFGGFLGMGDKLFAIPWQAFTVDQDSEKLVLNVTKDKLDNAPGFDKDNWPMTDQNDYRNSVDSYWSERRSTMSSNRTF